MAPGATLSPSEAHQAPWAVAGTALLPLSVQGGEIPGGCGWGLAGIGRLQGAQGGWGLGVCYVNVESYMYKIPCSKR